MNPQNTKIYDPQIFNFFLKIHVSYCRNQILPLSKLTMLFYICIENQKYIRTTQNEKSKDFVCFEVISFFSVSKFLFIEEFYYDFIFTVSELFFNVESWIKKLWYVPIGDQTKLKDKPLSARCIDITYTTYIAFILFALLLKAR